MEHNENEILQPVRQETAEIPADTGAVMEPVAEQIAEPVARQIDEPVAEPVNAPVAEPVVEQTARSPLSFAEDLYEAPESAPIPVRVPPQPKKKKEPKPRKKRSAAPWVIALALVLVAVSVAVTAAVCGAYWQEQLSLIDRASSQRIAVLQEQVNAMAEDTTAAGAVAAGGDAMTPGQVYAQYVDAVVAVTGYITDHQGQYESFGSGFIMDATGYVVTNYHVVENSTAVYVTLSDGEEHEAQLIGYDATNDIALLKMEGRKFPFVKIGSSDALAVGDKVAAIGNPLGELTSTLTVGYISAKDRIITTDGSAINMLQTDAAINSGNSGGPLFNMNGEVVGITTAKYSGTSSSGASIEGIGFAIPMDDVIGMIQDLKEYGYITGAFLGVYVRDVSAAAVQDGLPAGAFVESTIPGYCAEAAGLQARDIILEVAGYRVNNTTELTRTLRKFKAGDAVTVTVYRSGMQITVTVVLDEKPREQTQTQVQQEPQTETYPMPGDENFEEWYKEFMEDFFGDF